MATALAPSPYEEHRTYVLAVLRRRCGWLDRSEQEGLLHDAYVVLLEKQRDGVIDLDAMRPPQVRAYLTQTALNKALDEGKRAGRKRSVALDDNAMELPDEQPEADELLARTFDEARMREIVAELPERQQLIVKLRFFLGHSPAEVQRYLGVTERAYRRDLERAMSLLAERYDLVRSGTFCQSRRSLILGYVSGISGPTRASHARRHLATCPSCAHWAGELREAARAAGALVPLPLASVVADERWQRLRSLGHGLGTLRDRFADLVGGARDHVTQLVVRADPDSLSRLSGMRPGAVTALVAGCLSLGSTATYCALSGLPHPISALIGVSQPHHAHRAAARTSASAAAGSSATLPASAPLPTAAKHPAAPTSTPTRPLTQHQRAVQRQRQTAPEFGVEGGGTSAPSPAPTAPSPSASTASSSSTPASASGGSSGASSGTWGSEFGP